MDFTGVVGVFAACGAIWMLFAGRGSIRRTLRRSPTVSIANVEDGGLAKVVGRVRRTDEPALIALLSGRTCVYYNVTLIDYVDVPGPVGMEEQRQGFYIDDGTGTVFVPSDARARVAVVESKRAIDDPVRYKWATAVDPRWKIRNLPSTSGTEGILVEGETVEVMARWERQAAPESRSPTSEALYRAGSQMLVAKALPGREGVILVADCKREDVYTSPSTS